MPAAWAVFKATDAGPEKRLSLRRQNRMGGRAVECTGLEIRQGRKSFVGSNPTPSAIKPCQQVS
jgi:hypothetical protein